MIIKKYYCENCFEEELKKPIGDKFGGIYCSEKCREQCWIDKHNECVNNNLFD